MAIKHGMSHARIYRIWNRMRERCYRTKDKSYQDYGKRGITVCEEWKRDFKAFYEWAMANGYTDDLTIDRINVNGNYDPSNCRWITKKEQSCNTRKSHFITYGGKTQTISQWAEQIGIKSKTLYQRINEYHWDIEKALTTPIGKGA
jgi:hypothetical protein